MGLRFVLISAYTHLACFFSHRITYYLRYLWPNIPQLVSSKASILCIQKLCLPFAIIVYKYVCSLSFCLCNKFKSYFFNDIYIPYASAGYEVRFFFFLKWYIVWFQYDFTHIIYNYRNTSTSTIYHKILKTKITKFANSITIRLKLKKRIIRLGWITSVPN